MLLEVSNLKIQFKTEAGVLTAVDGISFGLEAGETLGIVGESGCGKSVTALSLMRLLSTPPATVTGKILFEGKDILSLSKNEIREVRGKDIAMIFQEPMTSLNPVFTVGFQISEAILVHRPAWTKGEAKARTLELLAKVGIADPPGRFDAYPHEMSGGMRQRIMIAMALACEPKLLVADEPTTALDVTIQSQILDLIRQLQHDMGMAMILITHDLGIVAEVVDQVMVMYAGQIVERAHVATLFSNPLHPYTKGLLDSLPTVSVAGDANEASSGIRPRLKGIKGGVPNLLELPPGCRFTDRCSLAKPHCSQKEPTLEFKEDQHEVSCFEVAVIR